MENIALQSPEDILLWPDGTWCYREELGSMGHKSDDFETIPFETPRWFNVVEA